MRKLWFGAAAVLVLVAVVVAWSSRSTHTDRTEPPAAAVPIQSVTPGPATPAPQMDTPSATAEPLVGLPVPPSTSDPDVYAAAIAAVVFAHDTVNADPQDYRALLMAEADPQMSARGRADLERMVADRIPTPELWERMRTNDQWSQWQTEDVWQPGAWDEVITSGQAEPGWVVRNVLGLQTVHFLDGVVARETARERTITIGMRCPAPGALVDRCRLTLVGIGVVS